MSLREKKFARTKQKLLDAALALMAQKPLEEVTVAEICHAAEVSYATFFNYFARKTDLLVYFIQLWSVEVSWRARMTYEEGGGSVAAIEAIFAHTASLCEKNPEVMEEIVAFQSRKRNMENISAIPLTIAEKALRFPQIEDFQELGDLGLESVLPPLIKTAIANGELPSGADVDGIMLSLAVIFLGTPVVVASHRMIGLGEAYKRQLALLWTGARGRHAGNI